MRSFLSALILLMVAGTVGATPPRTFSYQGVLTDNMGTIVPDGSYSMTFRIYSLPSGGSILWTETQSVTVTSGRFDVILGSVTPLTAVNFNFPYWLALKVGSDPEMTPRTELAGAPYSQIARTVEDNAITSTKIANNTVVRSLNGLDDNVSIVAGSNVTVTPVGNNVEISASGGGNAPGIAGQKGFTSGTLTGPGTTDVLITATITCPAAGYVLVIGTGSVYLSHASGNPTYATVGTSNVSTSIPGNQQIVSQVPANAASGTYTFPMTAHGVYSVSAGSNTFYLLGEKSANGSASVIDRRLTLLYLETAYGTVAPDPVSNPLLSSGDTLSPPDLFGARNGDTIAAEPDLASEVADLRARLATLEARLRDE